MVTGACQSSVMYVAENEPHWCTAEMPLRERPCLDATFLRAARSSCWEKALLIVFEGTTCARYRIISQDSGLTNTFRRSMYDGGEYPYTTAR